eukprot:scaffold142339_cov57-Phaeocystis_antarctica.AAC.1
MVKAPSRERQRARHPCLLRLWQCWLRGGGAAHSGGGAAVPLSALRQAADSEVLTTQVLPGD